MSNTQLRQQVEDGLAKSTALKRLWGYDLRPEVLQDEIDRMARDSREPETLRELFNALGNNPTLIAECLARPIAADQKLRNWYARDERVHGEQRRAIERELASEHASGDLKYPSGGLQETDEAFFVAAPIEPGRNRGTTAVVSWEKKSFDDWWSGARASFEGAIEPSAESLILPQIGPASCTPDSWTETNVLPALAGHKAVWTGAEMIVVGEGLGARYNAATDSWRPIARGGPDRPDAVIWTGAQAIVWNGSQNGGGTRYDPATNLWTPISSVNAPSARFDVSAIWTGQQMILWGGNTDYTPNSGNPFLPVNTGGRYNPQTDTWTPTTTTGAPTERTEHGAIWTGSKMVVWGGKTSAFSNTDTGGRYDPATDTWTATSTVGAATAQDGPRMVWTGSEMIVWGGAGSLGNTPDLDVFTGGRYNPLADAWAPVTTTNAPAGRSHHTVVWTGSEFVVWGGESNTLGELATGGRYNPALNQWAATSTSNAPVHRTAHTAVWTGTEMIVWGGFSQGSGVVSTGGRYIPGSNSWTPTSGVPAPFARESHTATWTGAEMVVWGGRDSSAGINGTDSGAAYFPATDSWVSLPTNGAPAPRYAHGAVWTGTDVVVFGGYGPGPLPAGGGRYRPAVGAWLPMSTVSAPSNRVGASMAWTGSRVVVWGGRIGDVGPLLNTGGRYDPSSDTWMPTSTSGAVPSATWFVPAFWISGRVVFWTQGGRRYDPVADTWSFVSTVGGPGSPPIVPAVVSSATEMFVLQPGGYPSARYNPVSDTWAPVNMIGAPTLISDRGLVWTGSQILFWAGVGSSDGSGARYTPATDSWQPINASVHGPTRRTSFTTAWTGTEMILWGGFDSTAEGTRTLTNSGNAYCSGPGPVTPPTALTSAATNITAAGATLNGSVNPNASSTTAQFEYGLTTTYGSQVTASPVPGSGTSPVAVSAAILGLICDTPYHFRVKATNAGGTTNGADATLRTAACPPTLGTVPNIRTAVNTPIGVTVTLGGGANGPAALTVFASSSNQTLVPNANLVVSGTGASRLLTITPAANRSSVTTIVITASDGNQAATVSFVLLVGTPSPHGDFDGDGRSDVTVFRPSDGNWYIRNSATASAGGLRWGGVGDVPLVGDFDGEGRNDIAVYRPSIGTWFIRNSATATTVAMAWGGGNDIPVPGDYDGDRQTDVAVFRPSEGKWYIRASQTGQTITLLWGGLGDVPVPGDYDADGMADIAVFRPSTGTWYIRHSSNASTTALVWGGLGDVPVAADYDGDGRFDIAVFRASNGSWYIRPSQSLSMLVIPWGWVGDLAVPADYDGDGKADVAIFRETAGTWFIRNSATATTAALAWGWIGDIPVQRRP